MAVHARVTPQRIITAAVLRVPRQDTSTRTHPSLSRISCRQKLQPRRQLLQCRWHSAAAAAAADGGSAGKQPVADMTYKRLDKVGLPEEGMDPEVQEAVQKVHAALAQVEQNVQTLHMLPSARLPSAWERLLSTARPLIQFAALTTFCAAMHSLGLSVRLLGSLAVGVGAGLYGWRRSLLSSSGAAAAALVGWATLGASFRSGMLLLTFFFASSKLTQLGEEIKEVDEEHKKGGQRNWRQVFCNALVPMGLALVAAYYGGSADLALGQAAPAGATAGPAGGSAAAATRLLTALNGAFLGYYACCCGDTWSSELGQLSPEEPRLITSMRPVRRGTNGGVTLAGLAASLAGGLAMGLTFLLTTLASPTSIGGGAGVQWWRTVALGVCAGFLGSLIDSVLGATIQFTGYNRVTGKITGRPGPDVSPISGFPLLDNNMVNAVSASLTAAAAAAAAAALF